MRTTIMVDGSQWTLEPLGGLGKVLLVADDASYTLSLSDCLALIQALGQVAVRARKARGR